MSTSEMRRGPGWWMDVDGQWQPPEKWPESSPPLPGWLRTSDGTWSAPIQSPAPADDPSLTASQDPPVAEPPRVTTARPAPTAPVPQVPPTPVEPDRAVSIQKVPDAKPTEPVAEPRIGLSYATQVEQFDVETADYDRNRRAFVAAVTAAVIAGMVGAGIVLLILL